MYYPNYAQQLAAIQTQLANMQTATPTWQYTPTQTTPVPNPTMPVQELIPLLHLGKLYLTYN